MNPRWRADYPPNQQCPALARRAARDFCEAQQLAHLVDDALLVISEMAANACRVSRGAVTVELTRHGESLTIAVYDDCIDPLPAANGPPGPHAENGRGLLVIHQLAESWGSAPTAAGKQVWCRLR